MVTVHFWRNKNKSIIGFSAKGHAGWGKYGKDVVCAGISALLLTTVLGFTDVIKLKPDHFDAKNGKLELLLPEEATESQKHDAKVLLNTLLTGLRAIQKEHHGSLRIYEIEKLKGGESYGRDRGH